MIKFPKINATVLMRFFANAWLDLTRTVQTLVEHNRYTNAEATALVDGEVLYVTSDGTKTVKRTTSDTEAEAEFAGVSCEAFAAGGQGIVRTNGLAWVLFDVGLDDPAPAAGLPAYTSGVSAGRASPITPAAGWYNRIGTIEDASTYATQGGCYVNINRCCTPFDLR